MPNIAQLSKKVSTFPNMYISPYGNDGVIPLYSSIPIDNHTSGTCLPCVLCGNSSARAQVVSEEAENAGYKISSSLNIAKY